MYMTTKPIPNTKSSWMEGFTSISNSFNNIWHATGHTGLQTVSKVTQWKIYDQKQKIPLSLRASYRSWISIQNYNPANRRVAYLYF